MFSDFHFGSEVWDKKLQARAMSSICETRPFLCTRSEMLVTGEERRGEGSAGLGALRTQKGSAHGEFYNIRTGSQADILSWQSDVGTRIRLDAQQLQLNSRRRELALPAMEFYLGPCARVSAHTMERILINMESDFLGLAVYENDFHPPFANGNYYTKYVGDRVITRGPECRYRPVIFGEISSLPVRVGHLTSVRLRVPDWSSHGWDRDALAAVYLTQISTLDCMYEADQTRDREKRVSPEIRPCSTGDEITVDVWTWSQFTQCYVPDVNGKYSQLKVTGDGSNFPFALGDTVIVGTSIHRYTDDFNTGRLHREYSIFAREMKKMRVKEAGDCPEALSAWGSASRRRQLEASLQVQKARVEAQPSKQEDDFVMLSTSLSDDVPSDRSSAAQSSQDEDEYFDVDSFKDEVDFDMLSTASSDTLE
ncbi:hypothetical protein R3P38DRAFT_2790620 [Favolaschia claudopus]|uniref:Uncharacterized protein n=1 Tax=Favolaschia claudopus TaxID=2862362 RepID=A0AAW0AL15_9AGAR